MPSSHHLQINEIVDLIIFTNPKSILDIGVGNGKYGFLSREYLEITGTGTYGTKERRIDGVEVFPHYITPLHKEIYSNIYIGNAMDIVPKLDMKYDLILMIDVFEHFTCEDGKILLGNCLQKGRNVIISVPKGSNEQGEIYDNPYEEHKYEWSKKDFKSYPDIFFIDNIRSLIVYIGENSHQIYNNLIPKRNFRLLAVSALNYFHLKKFVKKIIDGK